MKNNRTYGVARDRNLSRLTLITEFLGADGKWYIATNNTYQTKTEALQIAAKYPGSYVIKSRGE